jgi:hypothetical protein
MGVAADCEYVNHYGSQANASKQILTNWNTASVLYKVREREFSVFCHLVLTETRTPSTSALESLNFRFKILRKTSPFQG